jgi:ATP-dependent DNA ligase
VDWSFCSPNDYVSVTASYLADGYEGAMFRHPSGPYELRRSPYLLKYKPTEQDEYKIIGFKEGTGWAVGMLGAFHVLGYNDNKMEYSFFVGTGMTIDQRKLYWDSRASLLGKMLIVKHETLRTKGDIPVSTRVKGIK